MSLFRAGGVTYPFYRLFSHNLRVSQVAPGPTAPGVPENGRPPVPEHKPMYKLSFLTRLNESRLNDREMERLRVVPAYMGFYGGNPVHEDNMVHLRSVLRKYKRLPTQAVDADTVKPFRFVSFEHYKELCNSGTRVRTSHYKALLEMLQRLRSIDPELMPREVSDVLKKFVVSSANATNVRNKSKTLDEFGRASASAKRKCTRAHVYVVRGEGQLLVNGRSFTEYFLRDSDRAKVGFPFEVVNQENQYNVFVTAEGGGINGQAEATMYAIAKALVVFNPLLKKRLRQAGLMTPDSRVVERKKPGKLKARKSPTWVKR